MKNWPQRRIFFLVVWLTMISCISSKGQNLFNKTSLAMDFAHLGLPGGNVRKSVSEGTIPAHLSNPNPSWVVLFAGSVSGSLYSVPANIYYTQSGMMCKLEWQVEKMTRLPLRLRLGSLADCNAMEGK